MSKNPHVEQIIKSVADGSAEFQTREDARVFLIQSIAALSVLLLTPWFQRDELTEDEAMSLMPAITSAGVNAMMQAVTAHQGRN